MEGKSRYQFNQSDLLDKVEPVSLLFAGVYSTWHHPPSWCHVKAARELGCLRAIAVNSNFLPHRYTENCALNKSKIQDTRIFIYRRVVEQER